MEKDKNQSQIILYQTDDGQKKIQVTMEDGVSGGRFYEEKEKSNCA